MNSAPWTEVGRLQQDVQQIQGELYRKADSHEIRETNCNVASLEREVRELSTSLDGLRSELQQLQEGHREVLEILAKMTEVIR